MHVHLSSLSLSLLFFSPGFRPPIQFQRQTNQTENVQVEIPIDDSNITNDTHTSVTTEYLQHQSPTSSQTITTIASINRPDDNDCAVASDVSSLIKLNEMQQQCQQNFENSRSRRQLERTHEGLNNNSNSNRSRSSSRCRNICIKDFDHHQQQHSTIDDIRECKNVNISNMTELNKALMTNSHMLTLPRSPQARASFLDRDRCEMGVR